MWQEQRPGRQGQVTALPPIRGGGNGSGVSVAHAAGDQPISSSRDVAQHQSWEDASKSGAPPAPPAQLPAMSAPSMQYYHQQQQQQQQPQQQAQLSHAHSSHDAVEWQQRADLSMRALLEETVRLRGDMRAMAQQHASEKMEMQQQLSRTQEEVRKCRSTIISLEQATVSSTDRASHQGNQTAAALQHSKAVETKAAAMQQDALMRHNELSARVERMNQALQALVQDMQFTKQAQSKNHDSMEHVIDTVRASLQSQIADTQSRQSATHHRLDKVAGDVATVNDTLQQHLQRWGEASAAMQGELQQLQAQSGLHKGHIQDLDSRNAALESKLQNHTEDVIARFTTQDDALKQLQESQGESIESLMSAVQEVKTAQETEVKQLSSTLGTSREGLAKKLESTRQELTDQMQTQRLQLTQQLNAERQQRLSFEQDARAGIAIKLASVEDSFKQRVVDMEEMLQRTKSQAADVFRRFESSLSIADADVKHRVSSVEKVLKAEIVARTQATGKLKTTTEELRRAIKNASAAQSSVTEQMSEDMQEQLRQLKLAFESASAGNHSALKRRVDDLEVKLKSLSARETARSDTQQRHAASISALLPRMSAVEEDVQTSRGRVSDQLDAQLKYTKSQIDTLQRALSLKLDVPEHDKHVKEVGQKLGATDHLVAQMEDRLADLQQALDSQETLLAESLNHTQSVLQVELESVWRGLKNLQEDTRKLEHQQGALLLGVSERRGFAAEKGQLKRRQHNDGNAEKDNEAEDEEEDGNEGIGALERDDTRLGFSVDQEEEEEDGEEEEGQESEEEEDEEESEDEEEEEEGREEQAQEEEEEVDEASEDGAARSDEDSVIAEETQEDDEDEGEEDEEKKATNNDNSIDGGGGGGELEDGDEEPAPNGTANRSQPATSTPTGSASSPSSSPPTETGKLRPAPPAAERPEQRGRQQLGPPGKAKQKRRQAKALAQPPHMTTIPEDE